MLQDGWVTCPCGCENTFRVERPFGTGSAYAKKWKKLPQRCRDVCLVWISHDTLWEPKTKNALFYEMQKLGLKLSIRSFNARISELLSLGLISMTDKGITIGHDTRPKPAYLVNVSKMCNCLNNEGLCTVQ